KLVALAGRIEVDQPGDPAVEPAGKSPKAIFGRAEAALVQVTKQPALFVSGELLGGLAGDFVNPLLHAVQFRLGSEGLRRERLELVILSQCGGDALLQLF